MRLKSIVMDNHAKSGNLYLINRDKGIQRNSSPKNENMLESYPKDVDDFFSLSEQIWRNVALHHLLTNGSSSVNGCRQNESPNSW